MIVYIPQNIDPYNTHLKNLVEAYSARSIDVIVGYKNFISADVIPDIIHFHHLEGILFDLKLNEKLFFERLEFFKNKGIVFLYTLHNFQPHEKLSKFNYLNFLNKFLSYIDLFIHHGKQSIDILLKEFPILSSRKHIVCHHGDYLNDMRNFHESRDFARRLLKLPIDKKIILIFGQLQFKNVDFAEEVFDLVKKKDENVVLMMAGVAPIFRYNRMNLLYYILNNRIFNKFRSQKIKIHKRFSQHETYLLFMASDVVFLPHKSGLTSGIIPMAATLGKPFVYPALGVFEEQANYCIAEKFEPINKDSAYIAINKILKSGITSFKNVDWLENNNWDIYVENILSKLAEIYPQMQLKR